MQVYQYGERARQYFVVLTLFTDDENTCCRHGGQLLHSAVQVKRTATKSIFCRISYRAHSEVVKKGLVISRLNCMHDANTFLYSVFGGCEYSIADGAAAYRNEMMVSNVYPYDHTPMACKLYGGREVLQHTSTFIGGTGVFICRRSKR